VRDNGGNGLEVHAGDSSFSSNQIHNNSRSTGWNQPQVLFDGDGNPPATFGTEEECVPFGGAPCFNFDFRGDTETNCPNGVQNAIYSYNTADTGSNTSVGVRAINNAVVDAQNNEWQSSTSSQNVTQASGSFVQAELTCGTRSGELGPGPPVQ
jgi:hypothetical protein